MTDVIEFSLETIKIIYDCLSSEETCTVKGERACLYISSRPLKAIAANTSRSPRERFKISFSLLFSIKIESLQSAVQKRRRSDLLSACIQLWVKPAKSHLALLSDTSITQYVYMWHILHFSYIPRLNWAHTSSKHIWVYLHVQRSLTQTIILYFCTVGYSVQYLYFIWEISSIAFIQ